MQSAGASSTSTAVGVPSILPSPPSPGVVAGGLALFGLTLVAGGYPWWKMTQQKMAQQKKKSERSGKGSIGGKLAGATHDTCVYLDYNATTPIFPEVAAAMEPFLWEHFGGGLCTS
jgi:hypothetical protein